MRRDTLYRIFFILTALLAGELIVAQNQACKITSYDLSATLDARGRQILIDARLSIQKKEISGNLSFLLSHQAVMDSVRADDNTLIPFHWTGKDSMVLDIPRKLGASKNFLVRFSYSLPADSFTVKKGMIVMKRSERWYPFHDFELFDATLRITVPAGMTTLSSGTCTEKPAPGDRITYCWKSENVYNIPVFIFNPDSMEYHADKVGRVRLDYYFVPGFSDAQKIMFQVRNALKFYSDYLGKYPYDHFSVLEIPSDDFLGQAQQSLLIFTSKLTEYIPDPGLWVPHEVGHQWFGIAVIPEEHAHGRWFVEESVNEYLKAMYAEHVYGADSLKRMLKDLYLANYTEIVQRGKDVAVLDVVSVNDSPEEAQSIYAKGPIILHQLRRCMGDAGWHLFIKKIYRDYRYRMITLDDFKQELSKYDTDSRCLNLLNALLESKGIPEGLNFN